MLNKKQIKEICNKLQKINLKDKFTDPKYQNLNLNVHIDNYIYYEGYEIELNVDGAIYENQVPIKPEKYKINIPSMFDDEFVDDIGYPKNLIMEWYTNFIKEITKQIKGVFDPYFENSNIRIYINLKFSIDLDYCMQGYEECGGNFFAESSICYGERDTNKALEEILNKYKINFTVEMGKDSIDMEHAASEGYLERSWPDSMLVGPNEYEDATYAISFPKDKKLLEQCVEDLENAGVSHTLFIYSALEDAINSLNEEE